MPETRGLYALVPVKAPEDGKSRLASVMPAHERRSLNLDLARQAIEACVECLGADRTLVVTASESIARIAGESQVHVVPEGSQGGGLNGALALGADHAIAVGARGLVVVPTDLVLLSAASLAEALAALPAGPGCLVVPDRRGAGTNLLALSPARADLFRFGAFSAQMHAEVAAQSGYEVRVHQSPELALDLDLPEDYFAWRRGLDARTSPRQASRPEKILRA
jgi:2-phospho-L-lactate guanylyltransferase